MSRHQFPEPCECLQGYRVIEDPVPEGSEGEKLMFERQRAWCCSTTPEPAICGISRIWVVSMMRRQGIASRMLDCLRSVPFQGFKCTFHLKQIQSDCFSLSKHLVSQEQLCIWLLPKQRRDRLLWPNSGRKTFCHQVFWHVAVFSL